MKYALVGEKLGHSFSVEIHKKAGNGDYGLLEIPGEKLEEFILSKNFKGLNITIPYKEKVIPYLDEIDESAKQIGAINTIVNKNGRLIGSNTDYYGLLALLEKNNIKINGKKVAILGSGGTSKTATAVAKALGAGKIIKVSRKAKDNYIDYGKLYETADNIDVIINATPVGMFPNCDEIPVCLEKFHNLTTVVDVVYNPLKTLLVRRAEALNIKAVGGLYMLVAQALKTEELFFEMNFEKKEFDEIYLSVLREKQNIVLIGMPGCGKSTVGKIISEKLKRNFVDTDTLFEEKNAGIAENYISLYGEEKFREEETKTVREASLLKGCVIATGGGIVTKPENIEFLKTNGIIIFIDRPLEKLSNDKDRPLSNSFEKLQTLYNGRIGLYNKFSDFKVINDASAEKCAEEIVDFWNKG